MPQFDLPVIPPEPAARTTANATCTTDAQFAHSPAEVLRRRRERIQAANEAVDEYMRASDTRDYRAAFRHIERTRPELFAQMQVPAGTKAAENFNPYHDQRGRFTTGDGAKGKTDDGLDGRGGGGEAKPPSIRGHAYDSRDFQTCVVASIRSLIATKHPDRVPSEEAIKAQLAAAAKSIFTKPEEGVNWSSYGVSATAGHFGALVQQVLANNGVKSTLELRYPTTQQLSDALIQSGHPAIVNLQREGEVRQHSVAVQWDREAADGRDRFLINNVTAKGYTDSFTKEQFESGQITSDLADHASIQRPKPERYRVNSSYAVIITQ
jgi:hypothetical protein